VQVSYAARLASTPQLSLVQTQAGREPLGFLDCFRGWSSAAAAAAGSATTTAGAAATAAATAGAATDSASKPAALQFEALDFAALGTEDSDDEADDTVTTLHDTAAVATALTQLPTAATATVQQQQQQQQQPPQQSARALPPLPPAPAATAAAAARSAGRASLAPPTAAAAASATATTSSTTTVAGARSRNVSFGPDGRPDFDACFSLGVDLVSGLDSVDFNALNNNLVGSPLTSEGGYSTRSNSPPRSPLSDCGSEGGAAKSRRSSSKHAQQAAAQKRQSGAESARRRQQQRQARQSLGSSGHSAGSGKRYSSTAAGRRISSFFRSVCRVSLAPAADDDDHDGDATASTSGRSPRVSLAPLSRTGSWVSVSAGVESDVRAAAAVRQQQQQQQQQLGQALSRSAHARLPPRSTSSRAKRGDPFAAADEEHTASAATAAVLDPTVAPTPLRHSAPPKPSGVTAASTAAAGAATAGEATATATATKRDRVSNLRALHVALVSITVPVCSQPYSSIAVRTSAVAVAVMMTLTPYSALCKPRRVCNGMQRMLSSLTC
jgi:trimeric autotransporter adhesin